MGDDWSGRAVNWASRNEHAILAGVQIANWAPSFANAAWNTYKAGRYVVDRGGDLIKRQRTDRMEELDVALQGEDTMPVPDPVEPPVAMEDAEPVQQVLEAAESDDEMEQPMIIASLDNRKGGGGPRSTRIAKLDSRSRLSRIPLVRES